MTARGFDPLEHRMYVVRDAASSPPPALAARVTFHRGTAERIPAPDATVDLMLCREMRFVVALTSSPPSPNARARRPPLSRLVM
jgi:hypothetical protein